MTDHHQAAIGAARDEIWPKLTFDKVRAGLAETEALAAAEPHLRRKWAEEVRGKVASRLESAWDEGNAMGLDGWIGPGRGEEPDSHAISRREKQIDKLTDEIIALLEGAGE